ncbi:50S ribosomal protein L25 [Paenibacillus allorhizoplanae]|uniref:Large ribosomal subunit protein bL25 n=1 Tax=Paenibacillus allorhizoplanae TaxID=2905648 RepID=A0ABN8FTU8_9BACL|nr:50S ribosomal protein L25 [Paenibacillus allorhizoplanae]CAH1192338.1 50S ribosomal protein L25 [Paenibacillus allorhizoplanae]
MSNSIQLLDRTCKLKQMRKQGQIPAVVYSSRMKSEHVAVEDKVIRAALKSNAHAILEVVLPSKKKHPVMIHQVQKDSLSGQLIHIDFLQINMKEKLDTAVAVHFSGEPIGTKEGGMLQIEMHEVLIRCMPNKLPSSLDVDISKLSIGDKLHVSDLDAGNDVEILTDPEAILVTILAAQKLDETLEPAAEESQADSDAAEAKSAR